VSHGSDPDTCKRPRPKVIRFEKQSGNKHMDRKTDGKTNKWMEVIASPPLLMPI